MSLLSNLDLIRRVPLFSTLTQAQAESVADSVVKRRFKRGECIVEQGKKSNCLAIVLTGRARVVTTDTRGREVILAVERSDFPVIKAITVYVAAATMVFNLLADLLYQAVDPRVQLK